MFARVQENTCVEFINFDPVGCFHPNIKWVPVPSHLQPWATPGYIVDANDVAHPGSLDQLRTQVEAAVAAERFKRETSGITLSGSKINTDRASQSMISGAYSSLKNGILTSIDYKSDSGFITLDLAAFEGVAQAVAMHVQACFTAEKTHLAALAVATLTEEQLAGYDFGANWPTTDY